jgi:hypothetical protein
MRTGASLGWRIATAVAFGATAALAVTLSRGVPLPAALTSDKGADAQHAQASARPASAAVTARCAASGLRISMGPGARVTVAITRYPLDFTNVSGASCTLFGYPLVAAYRGDGLQVGAAAGDDLSAAARRVLLAPGQTAHAALDAAVPAARCTPVRATGLRVVPPGDSAPRYVRRPLTTCTVRAARGQDCLRVHAIAPGASAGTGTGTVAAFEPSSPPARSPSPPHPAGTFARPGTEAD